MFGRDSEGVSEGCLWRLRARERGAVVALSAGGEGESRGFWWGGTGDW